jgi:two-component system, NtrC family, sensor kinase
MHRLRYLFVNHFGLLLVLILMQLLCLLFFRYLFYHNTFNWINISIELFCISAITFSGGLFYVRIRTQKELKTFNRMLVIRKDKLEYLSALDNLKNTLLSMNSIESISDAIIQFVKNLFSVQSVKIYLWEDEEGFFIPHPKHLKDNSKFYVFDPFLLWLADNDKIFTVDEFQEPKYAQIQESAFSFFEKAQASLLVPLTMNNSLLGILTISNTTTKAIFKKSEIEKLYEVQSVAIMSISNATFYSRLINLTENLELKVRERTRELEETQSQLVMSEKMASLGVMVAGIAHEINTPAGVINGAADNLSQNMEYIFKNIPEISGYLKDPEIQEHIQVILNQIHQTDNRVFFDVKNKFKIKRGIQDNLKNAGINESIASDLSNFIIDNHLQDQEELLIQLVSKGGEPVVKYLQNLTLLYMNQKNIKYAIKNIVRIVRALKYYSHLDQASFAEADVTEGIDNTLIIMNNQLKHGVHVIRNYTEVPKIYCNLDELNQVWTNIVQNAIQAMKGKGTLTISVYGKEKKIHIDIQDNGPGIPENIIDRIWDPFFTTKDQGEGSGLGLGIVKGIIEKHRGHISVRSKPGETTFTILLPTEVEKTDI